MLIQLRCIPVRSVHFGLRQDVTDLRQHCEAQSLSIADLREKLEQKENSNILLRQQLILHCEMKNMNLSVLGRIAKMSREIDRHKADIQELSTQLEASRRETLELRQIYESPELTQGGHPRASTQPPLAPASTKNLHTMRLKIEAYSRDLEATSRDFAVSNAKLKAQISAQDQTIRAQKEELEAQQKRFEFMVRSRPEQTRKTNEARDDMIKIQSYFEARNSSTTGKLWTVIICNDIHSEHNENSYGNVFCRFVRDESGLLMRISNGRVRWLDPARCTLIRPNAFKMESFCEDLNGTMKQYYRFFSSTHRRYLSVDKLGDLRTLPRSEYANVYDRSTLFHIVGTDVPVLFQNALRMMRCAVCDTMMHVQLRSRWMDMIVDPKCFFCAATNASTSTLRARLLSQSRTPCANGAACTYKLKCSFGHCENEISQWLAERRLARRGLVR